MEYTMKLPVPAREMLKIVQLMKTGTEKYDFDEKQIKEIEDKYTEIDELIKKNESLKYPTLYSGLVSKTAYPYFGTSSRSEEDLCPKMDKFDVLMCAFYDNLNTMDLKPSDYDDDEDDEDDERIGALSKVDDDIIQRYKQLEDQEKNDLEKEIIVRYMTNLYKQKRAEYKTILSVMKYSTNSFK